MFKGIAQRGKCSMEWFFGSRIHLICNGKGESPDFMITLDDVDDRKPLEYTAFVEFIYGKSVAGRGYIGRNLFRYLFVDGIQFITKFNGNMKGVLMSVSDRLLLRKRVISFKKRASMHYVHRTHGLHYSEFTGLTLIKN